VFLIAGAYVVSRLGKGPEPTASSSLDATEQSSEAQPAQAANADVAVTSWQRSPAATATTAQARALLESVSKDSRFRSWLTERDLVRRWVVVTDNIAEGVSPRRALDFLAPHTPFSVARSGNGLVIAPESYGRYDELVDTVRSVDATELAKAYRRLHPVLEAASRLLGYPAGSLDRATFAALRRIERAPAPETAAYVTDLGGAYAFEDPQLERLPDLEKQLLRMGPRNEHVLQAKAQEILGVLDPPSD